MEIIDNKAVLIRTRYPSRYDIIPRSKYIGKLTEDIHEVLVYWGLDEMRVVRNLGISKAPSPINRSYTWPGKYKPFEHQRATAAFLTLNRRAFCFNDPGTGKTMAALWAADYLMSRGDVRRVLVLCPLSIMSAAWHNDLTRSIVHRSVVIAHHSSADRRREMVRGGYDFVISNYDGLNIIADEIKKDGTFDLIIVDEANAYKNTNTRRWKAINSLIGSSTMLWMMTGTPAAQSPEDAYGLAKLVNPTGVPKYAGAWRDKVMHKVTQFKWAAKPGANELVHNALQPAIRFTKAECLDLPPVITETRDVPLTAQQKKYYKLLKEQLVMQTAGEVITAVNAAAAVSKLLQISAGAAYSDEKEVVQFDCTPRINVLLEVIEETDRKVLVFAPFRHSIQTIADVLQRNSVSVEVIHGDVTPAKRTAIFNSFQNKDTPRVLVIQPQAAAHGVTLTAADTVVFWGPVMSVETYIQCCARSDRQGQTSDKVTVIHLQGSDIERKMFKQLESRVDDHALLIKLYEEALAN